MSLGFLYGGNARPQPSPPPDPVDVSFEMPLTDEFSEYELVKDGDGAGVEACLLFVKGHAGPGKDEVAGADGRRDRLGECVHVNDKAVGRE